MKREATAKIGQTYGMTATPAMNASNGKKCLTDVVEALGDIVILW